MAAGLLSACGDADYYLHLARGQARLLLDRRPLAEVMAAAETDAAVRTTLERVDDIRRFARQHVGLRGAADTYNYYFDTGGQAVAWNVSASPPDRFEPYLWWFPVVGRLPYKGYFERQRAIVERDRLQASGLDAIARPVAAYSTLGYLEDPVLSTMVDDSEERLADLILHELTHATIYVADHTDYNESVATFVGAAGSLAYLAERHGAGSAPVLEASRLREDTALFRAFVRDLVARLDSLYASGRARDEILRQRQVVFAAAQEEYRARRAAIGGGRFDGFLEWQLNNARLLSYRRYHSRQEDFQAVLDRHGGDLAAAVRSFAACADSDDPWVCLRTHDEAVHGEALPR